MRCSSSLVSAVMLALLVFLGCSDDDSASRDKGTPDQALQGSWDVIGFIFNGEVAQTTGTAAFLADGSFSIEGTITISGKGTDDLNVSGTYSESGSKVALTIGGDTTTWTVEFAGDQVVLTEVEPDPNSITLRRS